MLFNHPSAFVFSTPYQTTSSSSPYSAPLRGLHIQLTPPPHVGASEGPTWSPYLKSSQQVSSRLYDHNHMNWSSTSFSNISHGRSRSGPSSSSLSVSSASISASMASSACFSLSMPSEDGDTVEELDERDVFNDRWKRFNLEEMAQEPPSPLPSFSKIIAISSDQ
ncbi:hypothetical protein BX616_001094 [Lobosporangium transversale]|uniref:Uncharacterized protein n=1 Tax=Lobosporangium transversale TaxID=64571 RepID=A0A1Y2H105_9FUNG|nr:hypothetical protein BCR41DRAFT_344885 [Lobosporangium transversale]KAF9905131.1 hypothetical protein BX616_001094 [Lobosporangium transversale]ORZ28237.1 hypothetical protein BCR41DRAFT_344885 [Lobosporangium transversale]|eukprot:XP_021885922.1 hypothetical protein BCR41DRAFT_344885 [Lobosporangium transversale]